MVFHDRWSLINRGGLSLEMVFIGGGLSQGVFFHGGRSFMRGCLVRGLSISWEVVFYKGTGGLSGEVFCYVCLY